MDEIITEIGKSISWYRDNVRTDSVEKLMYLKTRLVTFNYNLAEWLAAAKKSYNDAYFMRKIETAKQKNAYMNQSMAGNKAESAAMEDKADELQAELDREAEAYKIELLLRQSNKVVEDITQRISIFKIEKNYSGQI